MMTIIGSSVNLLFCISRFRVLLKQNRSLRKFPFQEHVPVFHNVQIPYVHQLQNVLHEHNENISIHMQIFKI